MNTNKNNENSLILALLQNSSLDKISKLLNSEINWDIFFRIIEENRIIPIIYGVITSNFIGQLPLDVLQELKTRQKEISKLNFGRTTQLIKLINLVQEKNIPVIAYKGMALASVAYQDVTLRQFTDIDLLINKKDFLKVKNIFTEINCFPAWKLTIQQEKSVLKYYYEYPFFYPENKTLIEVHWNFIESFFAFELKGVFERLKTIKLYGKTIKTLSNEDHLIIVSVHGSKHFWRRLSWIIDIAKLVENTEINWDLVERRAKESGSLRMVWLALGLAQSLLETNLPIHLKENIAKDKELQKLLEIFGNSIFSKKELYSDWTEMAKLHLMMRERKKDRIKYMKRLLATKLIDSFFLPMGRPQ